jgi:hypothetical protein
VFTGVCLLRFWLFLNHIQLLKNKDRHVFIFAPYNLVKHPVHSKCAKYIR